MPRRRKTEEPKAVIPTSEEILDVDGLVALTGYAKQTLYNMMSAGEIPYYRPRKRAFFVKGEILAWMARGRRAANYEVTAQASAIVGRV